MIHTNILLYISYNCLNVSLDISYFFRMKISIDHSLWLNNSTDFPNNKALNTCNFVKFPEYLFFIHFSKLLFINFIFIFIYLHWMRGLTEYQLQTETTMYFSKKKNPLEFIFFLTLCWIKPNMQCASMQFTLLYFEKRPFLVLYA